MLGFHATPLSSPWASTLLAFMLPFFHLQWSKMLPPLPHFHRLTQPSACKPGRGRVGCPCPHPLTFSGQIWTGLSLWGQNRVGFCSSNILLTPNNDKNQGEHPFDKNSKKMNVFTVDYMNYFKSIVGERCVYCASIIHMLSD